MNDYRQIIARSNAKWELIKQAEATIAAFDKQWLENDYLVLNELLWVLAEAHPDNREDYILPIFQSAITSKALTIWDENKSFKLNDKFIHAQSLRKELLLKKALVLKQDFLVWQQQANNLSIPQWLVDLGGHDIVVEPDIQAVATENEALKAKVAELEKMLSKRIDVREQTTYQNLIVVLLDYIEGESAISPKKHPSFENITKLIDLIGDKYKGYDGLTKSNLSRKIPAIKKWFNQQ